MVCYQTAYAMDAGLPDFRRAIEFRKYYAVPLNFMFFSAYSEVGYLLLYLLINFSYFDYSSQCGKLKTHRYIRCECGLIYIRKYEDNPFLFPMQ